MAQLKPLLTIPDVAKTLRVSPSTMRSLIQAGHYPQSSSGKVWSGFLPMHLTRS